MSKGFHLTLKFNLPNIYKFGLMPKIGRRSFSVGENNPILSFCSSLKSIKEWKRRLYPNISLDDLVILTFDIEETDYIKRYDSYGDLFAKNAIPTDKIRMLEFNCSIEELDETKVIERELTYRPNIISEEDKKILIEKLASYEHTKWSQFQDSILWTSENLPDGSKIINKSKLEQIIKNLYIEYDQTDEIYQNEIKKIVMETFFLITESIVFEEFGISQEELIQILSIVEHGRRNRWIKHILNTSINNNGLYIIPKEAVDSFQDEILTSYDELSEGLKELDRNEVYNIIDAIDKFKDSKRIL